jgi:hypothetical protein
MRCLYQKDERALPGNIQNRKYSFFLSYSPKVLCLSLLPHFFLLNLSQLWVSYAVRAGLYNVKQLRSRKCLETAVRKGGAWCEVAASLGISCETVAGQQRREDGSWGSSVVECLNQAKTDEDTADWEESVRAVVKCRWCELRIAL